MIDNLDIENVLNAGFFNKRPLDIGFCSKGLAVWNLHWSLFIGYNQQPLGTCRSIDYWVEEPFSLACCGKGDGGLNLKADQHVIPT